MSEAQTNGNGSAARIPSILEAAKTRHEARKAPAKEAEVTTALKDYFKHDDRVKKLQEELDAAKADRTQATLKVVELRGMGRIQTKTKGVGQITARGDGAWINFATATGDSIDI